MKAQSSVEFLMMVGLFMIVFLAFFAILGDRMIDFQKKKQITLADDMLYYIESEMLMAAEAHDGYQHNFTLQSSIMVLNMQNLCLSTQPQIHV